MRKAILSAMVLGALAAPALADSYPVSGAWGQSTRSATGAIDCSGIRVINFNGNQRTDSKSGVPAYRNKSVTRVGSARYRIVDQFSTGQVSNATVQYTLRQVDADHIEMNGQTGSLKLQRCE
jgi:hypothetical protein